MTDSRHGEVKISIGDNAQIGTFNQVQGNMTQHNTIFGSHKEAEIEEKTADISIRDLQTFLNGFERLLRSRLGPNTELEYYSKMPDNVVDRFKALARIAIETSTPLSPELEATASIICRALHIPTAWLRM